jgi:hypothetical protein
MAHVVSIGLKGLMLATVEFRILYLPVSYSKLNFKTYITKALMKVGGTRRRGMG